MAADPSERAAERVGKELGKYTIERVLGAGGMAVVYQATHRNGNRVAIKVLHADLAGDDDVRQRFLREGYLANKVEHPGAVRVIDDDTTEAGEVFLVMELLEGETLDARTTRKGGRLSPAEVARIASQLLDVLVAAHAQSIVHRDLKPENVFITKADEAKILDFGIARLVDPNRGLTVTRTGRSFGTPAFMPPEQALGRTRDIDGRTDLWAVGATMFTALSGQLVHAAETVEEMFVRAGSRPARSIASVVPDVPPKLAEVIDRALAFKREDRFATAAEMRAALEEARQAQGGLETLPLTTSQRATQSVESQETLPVDVGLTLPRIATTRVGPRIAAVALVVGLAGGLAFSLTQRGGNANATPSAQASVVVTSSAPPPPKVEVASAVITAAPSVALAPSAAVIPPLVSAALSAAVKPASPPVAHPHATAQATAKPDLYAP